MNAPARTLSDEEFVERMRHVALDKLTVDKGYIARLVRIIDALRWTHVQNPTRCGSYPFLNLAHDFELPYGVVLRIAEANATGNVVAKADWDCLWAVLRTVARYSHFICKVHRLNKGKFIAEQI